MSATNQAPRAVIYLRQSLDATGDGLAVARQREDCLAIVKQRGWTLAETYVDNSKSASKRTVRRRDYDRMVRDYAAGKFDALVCWDLDRLTRQPRQLEDWIDAAEGHGLLLVTANGEADLTTDGGRLYARIKASVSRAEVERKSARQRRAARQRADAGALALGPTPYGYRRENGAVAVDEAEAVVVRRIVDRCLDRVALYSIAAELTADGVPTRKGGPWVPSTVRGIAVNPRYAGIVVYHGAELDAEAAWPAIVDEDKHRLVAALLADPNRRTQTSTEREHLGSGLYRCGVCADIIDGHLVNGSPVRAWSGGRYRCKGGCITRARARIDELVQAVIRARLERDDLADLLTAADATPTARALAERARGLRDRLARFAADYDAGYIDGARFAAATSSTQGELDDVEHQRAALITTSAAMPVLSAADRAAAFDAADLAAQRAVVDLLCTVYLLPGVHGRKGIDPESVRFEWRTA